MTIRSVKLFNKTIWRMQFEYVKQNPLSEGFVVVHALLKCRTAQGKGEWIPKYEVFYKLLGSR
jgi:hypothetical protein